MSTGTSGQVVTSAERDLVRHRVGPRLLTSDEAAIPTPIELRGAAGPAPESLSQDGGVDVARSAVAALLAPHPQPDSTAMSRRGLHAPNARSGQRGGQRGDRRGVRRGNRRGITRSAEPDARPPTYIPTSIPATHPDDWGPHSRERWRTPREERPHPLWWSALRWSVATSVVAFVGLLIVQQLLTLVTGGGM